DSLRSMRTPSGSCRPCVIVNASSLRASRRRKSRKANSLTDSVVIRSLSHSIWLRCQASRTSFSAIATNELRSITRSTLASTARRRRARQAVEQGDLPEHVARLHEAERDLPRTTVGNRDADQPFSHGIEGVALVTLREQQGTAPEMAHPSQLDEAAEQIGRQV